RAQITSSALATARLSPIPESTAGRLVTSCTPLSVSESLSEFCSAVWSSAIADRAVPVKADMSGCATQVALAAGSAPLNAAGSTRSGPYVVNPPAVPDPLAGTESSCQYGVAPPVGRLCEII